jgi:hypothetical protein
MTNIDPIRRAEIGREKRARTPAECGYMLDSSPIEAAGEVRDWNPA